MAAFDAELFIGRREDALHGSIDATKTQPLSRHDFASDEE